MLRALRIDNLVLIREADLRFAPGLDAVIGEEHVARRTELRAAWKELAVARRRHRELSLDAVAADARVAELHALVADTEGMEPELEKALRAERERLRHVTELLEAT